MRKTLVACTDETAKDDQIKAAAIMILMTEKKIQQTKEGDFIKKFSVSKSVKDQVKSFQKLRKKCPSTEAIKRFLGNPCMKAFFLKFLLIEDRLSKKQKREDLCEITVKKSLIQERLAVILAWLINPRYPKKDSPLMNSKEKSDCVKRLEYCGLFF